MGIKNLTVILCLFVTFEALAQAKIKVRVLTQEGQPAAGVYVQVGPQPHDPFPSNFKQTNLEGLVGFETERISDQPITLAHESFPTITYFNQSGEEFILKLPLPKAFGDATIEGTFSGWPEIKDRDSVTFGLFFPLLEIDKLFHLPVNHLVSSTLDKISIFGKQIEIPTNFVLPKQSVQYSIASITLEKDFYSYSLKPKKWHSFLALVGKLPLSKEVETFAFDAEKSFGPSLLNMQFERFGLVTNQYSSEGTTRLDMNLDTGLLSPCVKAAVTQPFDDLEFLAVNTVRNPELVGQPYQPTDFQALTQDLKPLKCIAKDQRNVNVISMGVNYRLQRTKLFVDPGNTTILARDVPRGTFLTMDTFFSIPQLSLTHQGQGLQLTRPERAGMSPEAQALHAILTENEDPIWVVFASGKENGFTLPKLNFDTVDFVQKQKKRWEVIWLGLEEKMQFNRRNRVSIRPGYEIFEIMTHAASNYVDF